MPFVLGKCALFWGCYLGDFSQFWLYKVKTFVVGVANNYIL